MDRSPSPDPSPLAIALFDSDNTANPDRRRDSRLHRPGTISIDFDGLLPPPGLLLKEDATEGCGGRAWPAGLLLARHLLRHRRDLTNESVYVCGPRG